MVPKSNKLFGKSFYYSILKKTIFGGELKRVSSIILLCIIFLLSFAFYSQTSADKIQARIDRNKGIQFYNYGYYQKANSLLKNALSYNSKDFLARFFYGWSYYKSGYIQNAIFEWENLKALGFEDNILENMLENILYQEGNIEQDVLVENYAFYSKINGKKVDNNFFLWPIGLSLDPKNNIYIAGHRSFNLLKLNNGEIKKSVNIFGKFIGHPYDVVYDKIDNSFFVTDYNSNIIYHLNENGTTISKIGKDFENENKLLGPSGIIMDSERNLYVIDQGNNRIVKLTRAGEFLFSFGKMGNDYGEFSRPVDIVNDKENKRLFVSNSYNKRIDCFDEWGNYLYSIGEGILNHPKGLHLEKNYLYIVDGNEIFVYDFISESIAKINIGNHKLNDPYGIIIDRNNNLIVTEPYENQVNYFVPKTEIYRNLDVKLERINIQNYPIVMAYISVKDQAGNAIYGLGNNNFVFKELDKEIYRVETDYTQLRLEKHSMSIIVDTNLKMKNKKDKVNTLINDIFNNDEEIISYNGFTTFNENQVKDYNQSKLYVRSMFQNDKVYSSKSKTDVAFYSAITSSISKFQKTGIIYITDGNFSKESFQVYSRNDIINYAKNNYVPIYTFYLGNGEGKTFLKELSQKSSGKFYEVENGYELVINEFKNYNPPYYLVYYISPFFYDEDYFRKVYVTVQYNGRVGKNWLGYFMYEKK